MSRTSGDLRKQQIDTLKIFNDNVMEIRINEEYSVGFEASGRAFQLDVFLTPNFPNESPTLALSPTVNHPWVQLGTGTIQNAPGLMNFSVHSDLGRVVRAIIGELERSIPNMFAAADVANQSSSSSSSSSNTTPTTKQTPKTDLSTNGNHQPFNSSLDSSALALPDLSTLSIDDLSRLNEDPMYLIDFVEDLDAMQGYHKQLDDLIDDVETITEDNLSKESQLNDLFTATQQSRSEMRTLGDRYEQATRDYQDRAEQFAPHHIKELLQIAVSTAESESEQHVSEFLEGKLDASSFLDRYLRAKVLSTVRKAKEDRLRQQLNALDRATF